MHFSLLPYVCWGLAAHHTLELWSQVPEHPSPSAGSRQRKPSVRPPVTLDDDAETAYNNAEPFVRDFRCLLSAGQWEIFQETRNAKAATRLTPTRTPVTTPATVWLSAVFYPGRSDVFSPPYWQHAS